MKGSFRSLGVVAAAAACWTCSVYDDTLLSLQGVTAGGAPDLTAASAGAGTGGSPPSVAGTKSNASGASGSNGGAAGSGGNGGVASTGTAGSVSEAEAGAAGAAGAGGEPPITCDGAPIPLKGSWRASASHSSLGAGSEYNNPPENLIDLSSKRWSTGKPQAGDEWFQIDFVTSAAVRELKLTLNPDDAEDYPRNYQLRISDKPLDFKAEIRASGAGSLGQTLVITLAEPVKGRYLLMQQKGKDSLAWWSVSELSVSCF